MNDFVKRLLIKLSPTMLLAKHLESNQFDYAFAIGKAASLMMQFAKDTQKLKNYLTISPYITIEDEHHIISSHPIPTEKSLIAGNRLVQFLSNIPNDQKVLALISGGSSAAVEVLKEHISFEDYVQKTQELIYGEHSIAEINAYRKECSLIKDGGLASFCKAPITSYVLSDVYDNDLSVVGSGVSLNTEQYIIGSRLTVLSALQEFYPEHSILSFEDHRLDLVADKIVENILAEKKAIATSEVILEVKKYGIGGRNQHLVLTVLKKLKEIDYNKDFFFMSCATDGIDGTSANAGAWIDQKFLQSRTLQEIELALQNFSSGAFFKENTVVTGPTFNNLLDFQIVSTYCN